MGIRPHCLNPFGIGSREGYEYSYQLGMWFGVPQSILARHEDISIDKKIYCFQIKTCFELKTRVDDEHVPLGSEIYCTSMEESEGETWLQNWMGYRMEAYWIPSLEIELLVCKAFEFAKRCSLVDDSQLIIPVVVDLEISTVQLERETIDEAYDRAISPEWLIPLYLCGRYNKPESEHIDSKLVSFLTKLERIRVECVAEGMSAMEVCPVCLRNPTIGAEISKLPSCGHSFHSHCILKWLIKSDSCPLCRSQAHNFPVCKDLPN